MDTPATVVHDVSVQQEVLLKDNNLAAREKPSGSAVFFLDRLISCSRTAAVFGLWTVKVYAKFTALTPAEAARHACSRLCQ